MTKLYYTIFNLIALAAIIFVGVDSFYRIVRKQIGQDITNEIYIKKDSNKKNIKKPPLSNYAVISKKNIFSKIEKVPEIDEIPEIENLEPTSLKITLRGTIFGDGDSSAAIIEDKKTRSQGLYRIGDSIQNGLVKKILRGNVVLKVGDKDEILTMDESTMSNGSNSKSETPNTTERPVPKSTHTIRRDDIDKALANINDLLSQANFRPHFKDGEADGVAITSVKADSIFKKMGLRNGDIIKGVDGNELNSDEDLFGLVNDLKSAPEVSLEILRRDRERILNLRFR